MDELMNTVQEWADEIGVNLAIARLIQRDVGVRTASRLCKGQYDSKPRGMLENILKEELEKDGFSLSAKGEKAV